MTAWVLDWVRNHEMQFGGIEAWDGAKVPYPEVSGYLIPSLVAWGEIDLAHRIARWLMRIQSPNGAFPGMDGVDRVFDTGAVVEGLAAAHRSGLEGTAVPVARAVSWMMAMADEHGGLRASVTEPSRFYTARASNIISDFDGLKYWTPRLNAKGWDDRWGNRHRLHYLAYGTEGVMGLDQDAAREVAIHALALPRLKGLMPMSVGSGWKDPVGADVVATFQWAILAHILGYDIMAQELYDAAMQTVQPSGGVPQSLTDDRELSWGAKFCLDASLRLSYKRGQGG